MTALLAFLLLSPPLKTVPKVDLNRYAGQWYEIARYPNWFQKACAGETTATYTLLKDGGLKVVNRCREQGGSFKSAEGAGRVASKDGSNSKLEVRFAPAALSWLSAVWGDYQIIALGPDYDYAVVGTPDRKYLWILARQARLPEELYRKLVALAVEQGFQADKIVKTRQEVP
jgi:apolipoprotein D and lipocalin family protein